MPVENVRIVDPYVDNGMSAELKLVLANDDEVFAVENAANFSFPDGYREYVTTLGRGEYCNYIRIHMLQKFPGHKNEGSWRRRAVELLCHYPVEQFTKVSVDYRKIMATSA